ncbi:hypothetical protein [Bradyrhizobium iriomotense]|uniref:Uncharacterized protein n=1 Tax=Bradyrhizobium iriomotense TaxID=441950 RepID=A0ABQ6BAU3_9BRAD|nr:hypothetical protein [Bradyrhizobium iriomotense]GLR90903.1 hypothetical protein GCM10007857_76190 [Bradyrhizobium iriomotense]
MSKTQLHESFASLLEELAALEHQRWAHWQKYVHEKGRRQPDGSLVLPADLVSRWERQFNTFYADLTDEEKNSDRDQVKKYLPILERWLSQACKESDGDV